MEKDSGNGSLWIGLVRSFKSFLAAVAGKFRTKEQDIIQEPGEGTQESDCRSARIWSCCKSSVHGFCWYGEREDIAIVLIFILQMARNF